MLLGQLTATAAATRTVIVAVPKQLPALLAADADGVNVAVYEPTTLVFTPDVFHVPAIPSREVVERDSVLPTQTVVSLNTGVLLRVTTIVTECVLTQLGCCEASGVNVYVVAPTTLVLIVAGDHVPTTPLLEVVGSAAAVSPSQYVCCMLANSGWFGWMRKLTWSVFQQDCA